MAISGRAQHLRPTRLAYALPCSSVLLRGLLQILVDESDCHASFTNSGSNAFDRAQPNIPAGKNTGHTRFEEVGIAAERPAPGLHHVITSQNISACIACDLLR